MAKTAEDFDRELGLDTENLPYLRLRFGAVLNAIPSQNQEISSYTYSNLIGFFNDRYNSAKKSMTLNQIRHSTLDHMKKFQGMGKTTHRALEKVVYEYGGWFLDDYQRENAKEFIQQQIEKSDRVFQGHIEDVKAEKKVKRNLNALDGPIQKQISLLKENVEQMLGQGNQEAVIPVPNKKKHLMTKYSEALTKAGYNVEFVMHISKNPEPNPPA